MKVLMIFRLLAGDPIITEVHLETCAHIQQSIMEGAALELSDDNGDKPHVVAVECLPVCEGACV